ncbi:hypothetical protein [Solidesulfovibrio sp.]|uniref:hypothetical protein n=1 Tax=Solidesulfovibrio sp. TaxID=2910990 RepID=UPI00262383FB|nr:hypothetical protein [Solidesulfovibrio sp.]
MQIGSLGQSTDALATLLPQAQADGHGLKLGRYSQADDTTTAAPSLNLSSSTSDVFAADILEKLQAAQTASNAGALAAGGAAGDLQQSLAETIDYVREKHGDAAATAVMGIIVKGVGDGSGGEDALGNALVSSLKFIDRNFGVSSGDAAIAKFNGALNDAVNGYFQNGHDELFYASDGTGGATSDIQNTLSATIADVADKFGKDTAEAVSDLMTQSLQETGVNRQGLGMALDAADAYLTDQYGASAGLGQALLASDAPLLPKGSLVNVTA